MQILGPALAGSNVFVEARLIPTSLAGRGGALTGQRVLRFLRDTLRQRSDTHVTTFFDLYGLPSDFPGVAASPLDPVGLDRIRRECAHFAEWLTRLESLPVLG